MKFFKQSHVVSTGLAMFSMFFGAGNVVFPLAIGRIAGDMNFYAMIGLLLTAVGVPFLGLISMILFDGNYTAFFNRVGKNAGFFLTIIIMSLIGPFAGIPRCIDLSFATLTLYAPSVSLCTFSLVACGIIFLLTIKKGSILDLLGYILGPLLIVSLLILIIKGLIHHPASLHNDASAYSLFILGLKEGYNTLDLFAAFFFSAVVLISLRRAAGVVDYDDKKPLALFVLKASAIGASLLAIMYVGLSYVAAYHGHFAPHVASDEFLGALAREVLGSAGGFIGNLAVALACLTTAITLAAVFADFLVNELFVGFLDYTSALIITVFIAFAMANLGFMKLMLIMGPIWYIFYPALIVLSIVNIAYKLFYFKPVKIPVGGTLLLSVLHYFFC